MITLLDLATPISSKNRIFMSWYQAYNAAPRQSKKNLKSQDSTEVSNQDIRNTVNTMFTTTSLCMHIKQHAKIT